MDSEKSDIHSETDRLLAAARGGDRSALDTLIQRLTPRLEAAAQQMVKGSLGARLRRSDLVQSALMQVMKGIGTFRGASEAEFGAWALRVLKNEGLQRRRFFARDKRSGPPPDPQQIVATPSREVSRAEDRDLLERAIEALEPDQRTALRMKIIEERPYAEIAAALERSEPATRMLVARARRNLALEIERLERG